jgi:hypothetical protein
MTRWFVVVYLGLALSAAGCGKPDHKQIADDRVRNLLFDKFEKREAIPFFEQQGKFVDIDATTTVDRDVVLPLLKRLSEVQPTEQWVMLKPGQADTAVALLVRLPEDPETEDRMAEVVQQADDQYSGFIIQQWGYEWLGMALVDQTGFEFLKKVNPDVEKQR